MAQMAEKFPLPESIETGPSYSTSIPRTGMPLNVASLDPTVNLGLEESWMVEAAKAVGTAYGNVQNAASDMTARVREEASRLLTGVEERAERVKNEDTLQLLAVIGGVAVLAGVATRIWRSNRYE